MTSPLDTLKSVFAEFGKQNPNAIRSYNKGHRLIVQGDHGNDCFLVREGELAILVKYPGDSQEAEIAIRSRGEIIGETVILQRRGRRTATVEVVSEKAILIRLTRDDILFLIEREDITFREAVIAIRGLVKTRQSETREVLDNITSRVTSVIIADIHNFSMLGEQTWEEIFDSFHIEFLENCEQILNDFNGQFEDQGDGFKIVFEGENHLGRAVECAASLQEDFLRLRRKWAGHEEAFNGIGLGIGICTDFMKKVVYPSGRARITSHAISIAAAMSKYKKNPSDVRIYLEEFSASMLRSNQFSTDGAQDIWFDGLGRTQKIYELLHEPSALDIPSVESRANERPSVQALAGPFGRANTGDRSGKSNANVGSQAMIDLAIATQIATIAGNTVAIVDKIYTQFTSFMTKRAEGENPSPSATIQNSPQGAEIVSRDQRGQIRQSIKYVELVKRLTTHDLRYIRSLETSLENYQRQWETTSEDLSTASGMDRGRFEAQLDVLGKRLSRPLVDILNFCEQRVGLLLDDHYLSMRTIASRYLDEG